MQQQVTTFAEAIAKLTGITEKEVMETFNIETLQLTEDIKHICNIWLSQKDEKAKIEDSIPTFEKLSPIQSSPGKEVRKFTIEDLALAFIEICCTNEGKNRIIEIVRSMKIINLILKKQIKINFEISGARTQFCFDKTFKNPPTIKFSEKLLEFRSFPIFVENGVSTAVFIPAFSFGHEDGHIIHFLEAGLDSFIEKLLASCRFFRMVGPWIMLTERALASKANVIDYFEKAYQDLHYIREVRKYLIENDLDDDARKKLEKELKDVAENYFPKQEKDMISSVITISDGLKLFREIFDEGNYTELINMLDGLSMILSSDTLIASDEFLINYSIQSFNISVFKRDKSFSDVALYRELLEFHPSIKKEFPFEVKDDTVFIRASHLSDEALKFNWKHLEKNQSVFANLMLALLSRCGSDIHLPIMNGKIPLIKFECEYKDEVQKINLQKTELSNMTRSECVAFITNQLFGGDSNKANFFNSGAATEFFQIIYPDMNDFYLLFIDSRIDDIKAHFESKEKSELIPPEEFEKIITSPSNIETLLNQSGTPNSNLVAQGSSMNSKDYSLSSSCEEEQKEPEDINDFLKTFGKDKSKDYLVKKPKITALDEVKLRIDAIKNHELSEKIDIELCYKGFIVSFQCDRNTSKEKIVGEAKRRFISLQNIQDDYIIFSIPGLSTSINNADLIDFLKTKSYLKLNVHIRKPSYIN